MDNQETKSKVWILSGTTQVAGDFSKYPRVESLQSRPLRYAPIFITLLVGILSPLPSSLRDLRSPSPTWKGKSLFFRLTLAAISIARASVAAGGIDVTKRT